PNPLSGRLLMFDRAIVVAGIDCDPAWLRAPVLRDAKRSRTGQTVFKGVRQRRDGRKPRFQPTRTSIAASASTKLPMISMLDDLGWKWSKRASRTGIVASLRRLAVVPFHLVQQWDRNVA